MNRACLAEILRKLADSVESADSAEGWISYRISERDPSEVDVDARIRTGNLDGQGGMLVLDCQGAVGGDR